MRNVHDDAPVLMKTRWLLSYLRGPLTLPEIGRLMASRMAVAEGASQAVSMPAAAAAPGNAIATAAASPASGARHAAGMGGNSDNAGSIAPALPADVQQVFVPVKGDPAGLIYRAGLLASARLHFVDRAAGLDTWQTLELAAPFGEGGDADWAAAQPAPATAPQGIGGAAFGELPAAALRAASYPRWGKSLATHLYQHHRLRLLACDALAALSKPGETEGEFRARLQLVARERRDEATTKLRQKYAPRLATLRDQKLRAQQRIERERDQASQQKTSAAISVGATLLGALFGRKVASAANVGRATTAARSASRIAREAADVARAEESMEAIDRRLDELAGELDAAVTALEDAHAPAGLALREVAVAPRKSDLDVAAVRLLWMPWRRGADGFAQEAF
jgi:hypothetical protein